MDLIRLKRYLQEHRIVPLQDMARHFRVDVDTVRPLLNVWIRKGRVRHLAGVKPPCKGCCQCDPATIEVYEWTDRDPAAQRNESQQ
ncbi:MAG: FeoC-like transcriptional regulator [Desulfobulbus sp.]|jgi:hypothetical protein|nr:FeoC-like transcriptional regulator [Desulfobulbus sp.]